MFRPPMEEGTCADRILLPNKCDAALADNLFEVLDGLEISVDQRLVDELPKVFRRLQFGTIRRLKHEPDAIRYSQVFWPMPSGAIELKDNPLVCASGRRFGKVQKNGLEQLLAHRVRDVPHRIACGRFDEAPDIEPFVTVMSKRNWALTSGRPDASQDRLQTDPMLVHRPDLDGGVRMLLFFFSGGVLQFFLARRDPPRLLLWDGGVLVFGWNI